VALTAHALAEVRERCLDAGMDDFLVKPYDELQIADMLGRWLMPSAGLIRGESSDKLSDEAQPSPVAAGRLDMAAVGRLRRISDDEGASLLGQVISQFVATSAPLVASMRAMTRDSNPDSVWRAAHSLRSGASAVGARRVSQFCEEIEGLARDSGTLPSEAVLVALEAELAAAIRELNELARAEQGAL